MVNKRILIFGLIAIIGISIIKLGTDMVKKNLASIDEDEIEIIRSDEEDIEIVEEEGMRKTVFYFKNDKNYLVPVMKQIPWEEGIAKTALMNMVEGSEFSKSLEDIGLKAILPAGTSLNGMSVDEETGLCRVDFSKEILNVENDEDEENLIKGVVYTLTEFPNIKEVQVMVDGNIRPVLKNSYAINEPLDRGNINLMGDDSNSRSKVVVYYKEQMDDMEDGYFVPVTIPTSAPISNVYTALDYLFEGPPKDSGLKTDIPSEISLQGVEIRDGTAFVDVNLQEGAKISEDRVVDNIIRNIGLTLSEFEEIETVELLLDGEIVNTTIPAFANEY